MIDCFHTEKLLPKTTKNIYFITHIAITNTTMVKYSNNNRKC